MEVEVEVEVEVVVEVEAEVEVVDPLLARSRSVESSEATQAWR